MFVVVYMPSQYIEMTSFFILKLCSCNAHRRLAQNIGKQCEPRRGNLRQGTMATQKMSARVNYVIIVHLLSQLLHLTDV